MAANFSQGPFAFNAEGKVMINGVASIRWGLMYGNEALGVKTLPAVALQSDVRAAFESEVGDFISRAKDQHCPEAFQLETPEGEVLARVALVTVPEGAAGAIPDDRFPFWLMTASRPRVGMPVTMGEFFALADDYRAPARWWISGLLRDAVMTTEPEDWEAPTSWEIRHIVGEGSLTGITGAQAAALVGVTAQNFRKYLAPEASVSRQKISFSMWHLLLSKLGITRIKKFE